MWFFFSLCFTIYLYVLLCRSLYSYVIVFINGNQWNSQHFAQFLGPSYSDEGKKNAIYIHDMFLQAEEKVNNSNNQNTTYLSSALQF